MMETMSGEATVQAHQQDSPTIWSRAFISIFITSAALNLGMFMSNSLLAVYANSLGATAAAIGMVMGTFAVSSIAFRFISAPIMDTYNRKYIVAFATLMLALAFFGFSISGSVHMLMVFRLVQGCGMAFGNACCLAMVSEMLPKAKYGTGLGYYSLAQVICQAIGPSVGLWLVDTVGYRMTYIFNAGVMLCSAALAMQIKTNFTRTKKLKISLHSIIAKEALLPTSILFILNSGACIVGSFLIVFAGNQGVKSNIGLYFTVTAVTMLITRPIIGRLTDRYGLVRISVPALFCNFAAFLIISYSTSLWGFLLAAFISAFGYGACQPAMEALAMKTVPGERRGAASSTNYIGRDMGNLVGPTLAGNLAQSMGYPAMWRVMGGFFLAGLLITFLSRRRIAQIEADFAAGKA